MNLRQINELWNEYKEKYDLPKDVQISAVQYDAEKYVEGFFNILELLDGKYILHLNPRFHLYSDSYARFILFHEFTHFYDFINSSFDETEDLFIYMNAYSEFHACRVTLARFMERLTLKTVHIDKIQIPGPFNEISIRHLLEEGLWRVKVCFEQFLETLEPNDFVMTFRQLMYLLGYISLFENDDVLLEQTLQFAHLDTDDFFALYHALKELEPVGDYVDARFYTNQALPLSKELIHDLYGDTISGSVTRMEKFAGCAFSHFMQYGLRLRKRLVHEILPTDMGKVFHKTMELVGKRSDWKFADDASRDEFVELMVEQAVTDIQKELFESSHRNEYVLERMKRISKRAVWAMEQHIKRGDFTPEEYEIAFGEENHLDSMTFALEDGEKMFFSGVVDRMDSIEDDENKYLKIIDYKSGKQKFDFAKIFHGLQMQLIIYMNAMMELYEKKTGKRVYPAGMFYFHMDDPIVNVEYENEAEDKILKDLKMSGVVNEDFQLIDHMEHTGSEGYLTLPVRATKNGYDKRSSVLNTTQLFNLGRIVEKKMTELGNSLMHGDISIKPYEYEGRKPCEYCEFKNICAYEDGVDQVEKIKKVSLEEGKHALDQTTAESH